MRTSIITAVLLVLTTPMPAHAGERVRLKEMPILSMDKMDKMDARWTLPRAVYRMCPALRTLWRSALAIGQRPGENNPTTGVQKHGYHSDGHHTWTDEQIGQFRAFYPLGSKQRVAMDLASYTSCRREDVVIGSYHSATSRFPAIVGALKSLSARLDEGIGQGSIADRLGIRTTGHLNIFSHSQASRPSRWGRSL